ncbi:hypothetical protein M9Y10_000772 [Tritrichomonas musculus]|uniref:Uncharacterized protein n=1 Tax=Tritrichomonas musculus TaxID=1915356 RepID=A0ABR2L561_9EUKA
MTTGYQQFQDLYGDGSDLTPEKLQQISQIDYSTFDIDQIDIVQKATKLPPHIATPILRNWMRMQDELISNLRGSIIYQPSIPKSRVQDFVQMIRCPKEDWKNDLQVKDIFEKIATAGGTRPPVPIINPNNFNNGLIRFDQPDKANDTLTKVEHIFDFRNDTYYDGPSINNAFVIFGFPEFMKVKLTSYKIIAPPKRHDVNSEGGLKSWDLFGSNDWEDIRTNSTHKIDWHKNDQSLFKANSVGVYNINSQENDYFRYFKICATGTSHQNNNNIILGGIDFTGNIITSID